MEDYNNDKDGDHQYDDKDGDHQYDDDDGDDDT